MNHIISSLASLAIIFCLSSFTSSTTSPNVIKWEKLESRSVDYKLDRDVIHVGAKEGRFSKLKLAVTGGALNMHKMKVNYQNGQSEDINLRYEFDKKSSTRVIDLNGNKRIIKRGKSWKKE